jgi:hypothetical protein
VVDVPSLSTSKVESFDYWIFFQKVDPPTHSQRAAVPLEFIHELPVQLYRVPTLQLVRAGAMVPTSQGVAFGLAVAVVNRENPMLLDVPPIVSPSVYIARVESVMVVAGVVRSSWMVVFPPERATPKIVRSHTA